MDQAVLELSAGVVGGFYKNKESLILFPAHIHKGLQPVCAQIRIYRNKIGMETGAHGISNLYPAQKARGIGGGGGTVIPSLNVTDHDQSLILTVVYRLCISLQPLDAKHLIQRDLLLD